ncbi:inner nuclear membrane protein enriched at telomere/subtelomere region, partial [Tulasnella sp. 403]
VFGLVASIMALRRRAINNAAESRRVRGLVQDALDALQDQETGYHVDPSTTPQPYIVPVRLRDAILQEEHSIRNRQRIWEKVQHVVEENANVRTNVQEVDGEDVKVWTWVGGQSTPARDKRRVSFSERTLSGTLLNDTDAE